MTTCQGGSCSNVACMIPHSVDDFIHHYDATTLRRGAPCLTRALHACQPKPRVDSMKLTSLFESLSVHSLLLIGLGSFAGCAPENPAQMQSPLVLPSVYPSAGAAAVWGKAGTFAPASGVASPAGTYAAAAGTYAAPAAGTYAAPAGTYAAAGTTGTTGTTAAAGRAGAGAAIAWATGGTSASAGSSGRAGTSATSNAAAGSASPPLGSAGAGGAAAAIAGTGAATGKAGMGGTPGAGGTGGVGGTGGSSGSGGTNGMCSNQFCFDVFECWLWIGPSCNYSACEGFVCK